MSYFSFRVATSASHVSPAIISQLEVQGQLSGLTCLEFCESEHQSLQISTTADDVRVLDRDMASDTIDCVLV